MSLLILVHHGDAVGPEVDPMRPLSSAGRAATDRLKSRPVA
jgi:phosphohistidine phosphatase SixA